jgi:hypothetical protein
MNTEILMSFAMAHGGAAFANWLRDKLMKHYGLAHLEAVYVDSVVSRADPAAVISSDKRPEIVSQTGAFFLGARLENWNQLYKKAMSQAKVMLFVLTPEYRDSIWCMKEWGQMHMENGRRRREGRPPLRAVVLEFVPVSSLIANAESNITRVPVVKVAAHGEPLLWDRGAWCIPKPQLDAVIRAIGPL